MRVVIDTNCLLVAIPLNSPYKWLYEAFMDESFEWFVSTEILKEYEEKIGEFFSSHVAEFVLNSLDNAPNVVFAELFYRWGRIEADPDDNKFADLALCMNVDYLVTNDRHFKPVEPPAFPSVCVVNIDEFGLVISR